MSVHALSRLPHISHVVSRAATGINNAASTSNTAEMVVMAPMVALSLLAEVKDCISSARAHYLPGVRNGAVRVVQYSSNLVKYSVQALQILGTTGLVAQSALAWAPPVMLATSVIGLGGGVVDMMDIAATHTLSKRLKNADVSTTLHGVMNYTKTDKKVGGTLLLERSSVWHKRRNISKECLAAIKATRETMVSGSNEARTVAEEQGARLVTHLQKTLAHKKRLHTIALLAHTLSMATIATAIAALIVPCPPLTVAVSVLYLSCVIVSVAKLAYGFMAPKLPKEFKEKSE